MPLKILLLKHKTQLAAAPIVVLSRAYFQTLVRTSGQQQLGQGPVVGLAFKRYRQGELYLHSADVKAVIPPNLKLLWECKTIKR
jgi:SecD/SecF fusion protein